jgi:hypothetical protein
MSRVTVGYLNGVPIKRDEGPANGATGHAIRGSLVVGEDDRSAQARHQAAYKARKAAAKAAAA